MMKLRISVEFIEGYSKVLDLFGTTKEWPELSGSKEKDFLSLRSDWDNVGNDIRRGTTCFKRARG